MKNIYRIIAENGGQITLQMWNTQQRYQHTFIDPYEAARCIAEGFPLSDQEIGDWDGNDLDSGGEWLDPVLVRGPERVEVFYTVLQILLANPQDMGGTNMRIMQRELRDLISRK